MLVMVACNQQKSDKTASIPLVVTNSRLSANAITRLIDEYRIDRTLVLPEQRFDQRVALLNSILVEEGFTDKMVTINIDPQMQTDLIRPPHKLANPKISFVFMVTMDMFKVMYRVFDGEIRFMQMTNGNFEKYPRVDRDDPETTIPTGFGGSNQELRTNKLSLPTGRRSTVTTSITPT